MSLTKPYKVDHSDLLGRYLVTTRDVQRGEVLLKETPVLMGPRVDSERICLGCYAPLSGTNYYRCSKCRVATLCNVVCEKCGDHSDAECDAFRLAAQNKKSVTDLNISRHYQLVLPLRCLLLRRTAPDKWARLMTLEAHLERRRDTPIWRRHQETVVKILRSWDFLSASDLGVEDDDVDLLGQRVCGILDVNSFEIRAPLSTSRGPETLRGVYLEAALMAHDCVGNTHLAVDDAFRMTIHASVPIPAGRPIYFNYTSTMQGTDLRREHLSEGKYFECACNRCRDPTELGTHMSSLRCARCNGGHVIKATANCSEDTPNTWSCDNCSHRLHQATVDTALFQARQLIDSVDRSDPREMENLLKSLALSFHPNHADLLELKQSLVAVYRDTILREPNPSRKILLRKIELCRELLPVLEIIEPGISRLRGITLYELHVPIVLLANRDYESNAITGKELLVQLQEAELLLRDAVNQLLYEPRDTPENQLARVAMQELKGLRQNVQDVRAIVDHGAADIRKGNKKRSNNKTKSK